LQTIYRRFVHLFVNGIGASDRFTGQGGAKVYEDAQEIGSDYVGEWFPNQQEGRTDQTRRVDRVSAFATYYDSTNCVADPTLGLFTTTNNVKKLAVTAGTGSSAAATRNTITTRTFSLWWTPLTPTPTTRRLWMPSRKSINGCAVFAFEDVVANSDSFGNGNQGKNMYSL